MRWLFRCPLKVFSKGRKSCAIEIQMRRNNGDYRSEPFSLAVLYESRFGRLHAARYQCAKLSELDGWCNDRDNGSSYLMKKR